MTGRAQRFAGAVIVAAGRGERFGGRKKVLAMAAGRPLLVWSIEAFLASSVVKEVVVVGGDHSMDGIKAVVSGSPDSSSIRVCTGGALRQDSVRAGVNVLSENVEVAVIHDAARPLTTSDMIDAVAISARMHGAAIIATPVTDTIKVAEGMNVVRTVPRGGLWAAQTPQAFRLHDLLSAFNESAAHEGEFTDESSLMELLGWEVQVCPAESNNMKVTVSEDLLLVDTLLRRRIVDRNGEDVPS